MKVSMAALVAVVLLATTTTVEAFVTPNPSFVRLPKTSSLFAGKGSDMHEFDFLLGEGDGFVQNALVTKTTPARHTINVAGPDGTMKKITLASSAAGAPPATAEVTEEQVRTSSAGFPGSPEDLQQRQQQQQQEYDPYSADATLSPQYQKIQQVQERQNQGPFHFITQMNFREIGALLVIPSIVAFVAVRWSVNRATAAFDGKADDILDDYASEMLYHDGDYDEMKMCHKDYSKRLVWLGPTKKDAMLKRYLEQYAKKKVVSPQSISSLSYVFTLYKLSEEKAAKTLVSLCKQLGPEKISSSSKLLFFGSRILKSPEGKEALVPIKDMIKATYRDEETADMFVEASQTAMGEAAYRHAVQAAGKNQKDLTVGWEILGLDKEAAERIFEEEAEEGFVSDRETMYGGQTTKYDKKGRAIDKQGNLVNPEEAGEDDDEEGEEGGDDTPTGNVFECGNCGYTLFVAKGRDFKFYGDDFKCPECGAEKDQFVSRDLDEED